MELDEEQFAGTGAYTFAAVMDVFPGVVHFNEQLQPIGGSHTTTKESFETMAPASGTENPDVALAKVREQLFSEPCTSYDFFQAVRLLGVAATGPPAGGPLQPSTGRSRALRRQPDSAFSPPAPSMPCERGPTPVPSMDINFMGLIGPLGALPNYVTELIAARIRVHDTYHAGVPQHLQPPPDFLLLSGVGEEPFHDWPMNATAMIR